MTILVLTFLLAAPQGIDLTAAARYFDEAAALSDRDGGELWGEELYGPMMFIDAAQGRVVANEPDPGGHLRQSGEVFEGPLPEGVGPSNSAQQWAGQKWTTLLWPLPADAQSRAILLAHEMYHRIQAPQSDGPSGTPNAHLDGEAGRVWLRLEWRALAAALEAEGEASADALRAALTFRAYRLTLAEDAAEDERRLLTNEGLAEYTGVRLGGFDEVQARAHVAARLRRDERGASFARSFAYAAGPAYALLLDRAQAAGRCGDWLRGEADFDLAGTLERVHQLDDLRPTSAPLQAAQSFGADEVQAEERQRAAARAARLADLRARLVSGPVLRLPASPALRYSFNPYGVESLAGEGQVYQTLQAEDAWGKLEVSAGGALLRREGATMSGICVPAPTVVREGLVEGEGWRLTLSPGWRLVPGPREGDRLLQEP